MLILDAQVVESFAESPYYLSPVGQHSSLKALDTIYYANPTREESFCKEAGPFLKPQVPTVAKQPKQLVSSVLHWIVNQYPAGTILKHDKDVLLLDRHMLTQERAGE